MFIRYWGKSFTAYTEKNGKYYRQHHVYWEKGGYCVPQTCRQISEKEYNKMRAAYLAEKKEDE